MKNNLEAIKEMETKLAERMRGRPWTRAQEAAQAPVVPVYVTPAYPPEATSAARQWEQSRGKPAILLAFARSTPLACENCNGVGAVYIRLCSHGPYNTPGGLGKVSTWFEGDGQFRKGWYIVEKTLGFVCPKCKGGVR